MVDDARAQKWEQDARSALARFYGMGGTSAYLAAIVIALLRDREDLVRYAETMSRAKGIHKWGFLVEYFSGDYMYPERGQYEKWVFKDSPREHRLRAVENIPALLEGLIAKSKKVATELSGKLSYPQSLADSSSSPSPSAGKK